MNREQELLEKIRVMGVEQDRLNGILRRDNKIIPELRTEIERLTRINATLEFTLKTYIEKLEGIEKSVSKADAANQELLGTLKSREHQVIEMRDEIVNLKEKIKTARDAHQIEKDSFMRNLASMGTERDRLNKGLIAAQKEKADVENENRVFRHTIKVNSEEIKNLQEKNDNHRATIVRYVETVKDKDKLIEQLNISRDKAIYDLEQIKGFEYEKTLGNLQHRISTLNAWELLIEDIIDSCLDDSKKLDFIKRILDNN